MNSESSSSSSSSSRSAERLDEKNATTSVVRALELRCESKKHGELFDHVIEVKCSSRFCGASSDVVVIHRFDVQTGDLVSTKKFKSIKIGEPNVTR